MKMREDGLITHEEFERLLRSSQPAAEIPLGPPSEATTPLPPIDTPKSPPPLAPFSSNDQPIGRSRRLVKVAVVSVVAVLAIAAAILGVVLLTGDSEIDEASPSVETTIAEVQPVVVSIDVETDTIANPIPPNFGIKLGTGDPAVGSRLFEGSNEIEISEDFLAKQTNDKGEIRVTFWNDFGNVSGGIVGGLTSVFVRNSSDPSIEVTVTEDGISVDGPLLAPFEVDRPNPTRNSECQKVSDVLDKRNETVDAVNLIQDETNPDSSLGAFQDSLDRSAEIQREYLVMVSALDWVYFFEYEDLEPLLREQVDLGKAAAAATNTDQMNGLIESQNGLLGEIDRLHVEIVDAWNDTCI